MIPSTLYGPTCRFDGETPWLTQALMAELFQTDVRTINEHLVTIYDEGELNREATTRRVRMVRIEGNRAAARDIEHDNLEAIRAVGIDFCVAATAARSSPSSP